LFLIISFPECIVDGYDYLTDVDMYVKLYTIKISWFDASEICQNDGAVLVSITTLAKWEAMSNYLGCK